MVRPRLELRRAKPGPGSTRRGRIAGILLVLRVALGLAIGALVFDRVVMPWIVRHGDDSVVPPLEGKTREEADKLLRGAALKLGGLQEVSHRSAAAGQIVAQEPPAGSLVRSGRAVYLMISNGVAAREVPDLAGKTLRHARLELSQRGLLPGEVTLLRGSRHPEGAVVATSPCPGEMPDRSGRVDLLIGGSGSAELYLMPDMHGWGKQEAASFLRRQGLRVSVAGLDDRVDSQIPAPGEPVWSGSTVALE